MLKASLTLLRGATLSLATYWTTAAPRFMYDWEVERMGSDNTSG